jgi:hypothetical protein
MGRRFFVGQEKFIKAVFEFTFPYSEPIICDSLCLQGNTRCILVGIGPEQRKGSLSRKNTNSVPEHARIEGRIILAVKREDKITFPPRYPLLPQAYPFGLHTRV